MQTLRTIIDKNDLSSLIIPDEFGRKVEVIILPFEDEEAQFLTSASLSTTEDDSQENQIWGKYL
jgi:hypothetical protein